LTLNWSSHSLRVDVEIPAEGSPPAPTMMPALLKNISDPINDAAVWEPRLT
jgi:hypothetical protein